MVLAEVTLWAGCMALGQSDAHAALLVLWFGDKDPR